MRFRSWNLIPYIVYITGASIASSNLNLISLLHKCNTFFTRSLQIRVSCHMVEYASGCFRVGKYVFGIISPHLIRADLRLTTPLDEENVEHFD
jgi:hypothetical protein